MRTPEEIKKGLECLGSLGIKTCSDCVWHGKGKKPCREAVTAEAVACIDLMMEHMHGDCGTCKHFDEGLEGICGECLSDYKRPYWAYVGLPGDEEMEDTHV